jgi:hypothetical protein
MLSKAKAVSDRDTPPIEMLRRRRKSKLSRVQKFHGNEWDDCFGSRNSTEMNGITLKPEGSVIMGQETPWKGTRLHRVGSKYSTETFFFFFFDDDESRVGSKAKAVSGPDTQAS